MLDRISEIENALEKELFLPALALSLTIPDICGQIEFPELVNNKGRRMVKKQYVKWFDEWVNHFYSDTSGFDENNIAKNPYFTGDMCYSLRCSFLHSGNSEVGEFGVDSDIDYNYIYKFELCINCVDSLQESWSDMNKTVDRINKFKLVRIDIEALCGYLCVSAYEYYQFKGKEHFNDNRIDIINIQKEYEKISKLNRKIHK